MRFGLLGTGYWATETQATALAAHPRAELVAVWGRDPAKTGVVAERFGLQAYEQVDDLLAHVDAVAVALPPHVQAPLAARAARAGKHLLLDKPLALDVEDADDIVAATRETGVANLVFFTNRFDPVVSAALADAEKTGGWFAGRVSLFGAIDTPGSPYAQSQWRHEHGGLWDVGPHALARLLPVLGPVRQVTALAGTRLTGHVLLRHESGAVSEMSLTVHAPQAAGHFSNVFYGESGILEVPGGSISAVEAFGNAVDELLVLAQTPGAGHPCDVVFAAQVVRILFAALESVEFGRTISLGA
ncbi:Gfo/Idh/MocA family oxidoreductase [Hamadaea sp. NPDC050747]|uniref:Gfo/Idh/MocA family protein n=1 Tax=Hamadaea sp. NPDC050747 TaxID=3155789 RepID=UPI00340C7EA5